MTTTKAVTVPQIEALRNEARQAGDALQVIVCDIALDEHDGSTADDYVLDRHEATRLAATLAMTQEQAWAECVRVIRDAEAQS